MNETSTIDNVGSSVPKKQQAIASTAPPNSKPARFKLDEQDGIPIRQLWFRESIDTPNGDSIRKMVGGPRDGDKPNYQITWLPRASMYLVRSSCRKVPSAPLVLTHTFTIPEGWAIAEHEAP